MTTFTYPAGHSVDYDETIKVGDLITSYNEGFHRVTKIEDRPTRPPIIYYEKVAKIDGSPAKKLKGNCCSSYCRHAYDGIESEIQSHQQAIAALQQVIVDFKL